MRQNVTDIQTKDNTSTEHKKISRMIGNIQYNGIHTTLHYMRSVQDSHFLYIYKAGIYQDTPMPFGGVSSEDLNPSKINIRLLRTVCKESEVTLSRDNSYMEQREN